VEGEGEGETCDCHGWVVDVCIWGSLALGETSFGWERRGKGGGQTVCLMELWVYKRVWSG